MTTSSTRVIFFQVKDNLSKLKKISEISNLHFERREHFLILVDDTKALQFVDELLWKLPDSSFLPHIATDEPTQEKIAIAKVKKNINNSRFVFNLCPTPLLIESPFKIIYEFEDLAAPNKKSLSAQKFDSYRKLGYLIEAHPV
jgi:DNA polymerase-3 subunit chi